MLISRNRSRQGAPSAGGEGIVTYVEPPKSRSNAVLGDLYNQHRVTEGKETIPFLYRFAVRREDGLAVGKSADQHEKGAFGQVEVGDQGVDRLEPVAGA